MLTKQTAVQSHPTPEGLNDRRKARILIVDDELTATRLMKLNLEQAGRYLVRTENAARSALAAAIEFAPDIIFLDIIMPDLDGGQVAALLQSDPRTNATPIVFLTAIATIDDIQNNGGAIGGAAFLAKPAALAQVLACLDENLVRPLKTLDPNRP